MIQVNLEGREAVSKYRLRTCHYDMERWSICDSLHSMQEGHRTLWFYGKIGDRDECVVTRGDDMDELQGDVLALHVFTDANVTY